MQKCDHEHRISETRKRSFLKSLLGYLLEVGVDTFVIGIGLSLFLGLPSQNAFLGGGILATLTEFLCFFTHYFNERFWNKIMWGRTVTEVPLNRKI